MTKVIFKYPFEIADVVYLQVPQHSQVLTVQMQGDQPCVWVLCDPDAPSTWCQLRLYGTGEPLKTYGPDETPFGEYVGTIQLGGGALVFHVFARGIAVHR